MSSPLDSISVSDLKNDDLLSTKIPIPSPDYLKKLVKQTENPNSPQRVAELRKYEREYDLFCRWCALPKEIRKPKTAVEFEREHTLPKAYTTIFKQREDFRNRMLTYFWEWMFDLYPDVVHSVYKRAIGKSSKDAQIFVDLMSKQMEANKPRVNVAPMVLVGVPQDKIDKLFTPKSYDDATIVPGEIVKHKK
jgi:hypothetical protein